jgi:hypothetical protein
MYDFYATRKEFQKTKQNKKSLEIPRTMRHFREKK